MKLIVGLGNPGGEYERTRHNAGARAVRAFRDHSAAAFGEWKKKFESLISEGKIGRVKITLLLPQTFMNDSGRAVAAAMQFWKLSPSDVIVVFDDVDLPIGTVRVRPSGSAGGHNGMKDVLAALGTQEVPRIRIGLGAPPEKMPLDDFVLRNFSAEEEKLLAPAIDVAVLEIEKRIK